MIDIGKILKRAWHILWNYKVLWIFAFLLALTAGGSGGGSNGGSSYQFNANNDNHGSNGFNPNYQSEPWMRDMNAWFQQSVEPLFANEQAAIRTGIWIAVGFVALMIMIGLLVSLVRYPTETAIIRMVDDYEQTGTKVSFKAGWKLGWSRRAFRMWLIDLIIGIPVLVIVLLMLGAGILFVITAVNGNQNAAIVGSIAAIGCAFVFFIIFAILMIFLNLLRQFFVRAAAIEESTFGESFRRGWTMFKRNWKSAGLMWLVMLGIGIAFGIVSIIIFFVLIPAYAIMAIPGAIVSAIPAAIGFGITSLFVSAPWTWIVAALVALPFFLTIVLAPITLVSGLYMLYTSNIWTLTYREMKALEALDPVVSVEELPSPA